MIYVSSACIKSSNLERVVKTLCDEGFSNIELSGGTIYNEKGLEQLRRLKEEYSINFLLHNYFPTPKNPFVLNLASSRNSTIKQSLNLIKKAIDWSEVLEADKYAFHAGFLFEIPINELGKKITKSDLYSEEKAIAMFEKNLIEITEYNKNRVKLHVENNVLSKMNFTSFEQTNPFLFTDLHSLSKIEFANNYKILLDAAHLKVSCNSLSLNFEREWKILYDKTDYIHISDNDGTKDSNQVFKTDSNLFSILKKNWTNGKTITIEVYSGIETIKETYNAIEQLNKANEGV